MDDEFSMYDHGWRFGTFDKCNGKPPRDFSNVVNCIESQLHIDGYFDAYNSNDVKVF